MGVKSLALSVCCEPVMLFEYVEDVNELDADFNPSSRVWKAFEYRFRRKKKSRNRRF